MMGSIDALFLAVAAFVLSHVLISSTPLRAALVGTMGENVFTIAYSLLSAVLLVWIAWAYREAPFEPLWLAPDWVRWLPVLLMPFAAVFLVAGVSTPNVTAVGGERLAQQPELARGIVKVTRHPVMWAFTLWAAAHIPINGDTASLVLFGGMLVLALAGPPLIDRKKKLRMGRDWDRLAAVTSSVPFVALLQGRTRVTLAEIGWVRILLGLILYAALLHFHSSVIGVSPLP